MQSGYLVCAMLAFAIGRQAWLYYRYGSFAGAMLGGVVKREEGQVAVAKRMGWSRKIKVCSMESLDGEACVGVSVVSNTRFMPIKLSKAQAQELSRLLQQASA